MKTLNLINKYFKLLEQDEAQNQPTAQAEPAAEPDQSAEPLVSLAEQGYISLVAQAFAYKPPDDQINRVNDALLKVNTTNPRVIRELIESYLPPNSESIDELLSNHKDPRLIRDLIEGYLPDSSDSIDSLLSNT
jgi:hypothetical protein